MDYNKYKEYITPTFGITHNIGDFAGVNEIVFLTNLFIAMKIKGVYTKVESDIFERHLTINDDGNGGYLPKNSHDNVKMKLFGSLILDHDLKDNKPTLMSLVKTSWYRPWDMVVFSFLLGGTVLKCVSRLFLPLYCLVAIQSALSKGKIRPDWVEKDKNLSRWRFIFRKKEFINQLNTRDGWRRNYRMLDNDQLYTQRLHQNDGKHLYTIGLLALSKKSFTCRLFFRLYCYIMEKRMGCKAFMEKVWHNYFGMEHPVKVAWRDIIL